VTPPGAVGNRVGSSAVEEVGVSESAEADAGSGVQERVLSYLEGVAPDDVRRAARRYAERGEDRALALGRTELARVAAERANDGEAVEALIELHERELRGGASA
jgi:hypothetical protein